MVIRYLAIINTYKSDCYNVFCTIIKEQNNTYLYKLKTRYLNNNFSVGISILFRHIGIEQTFRKTPCRIIVIIYVYKAKHLDSFVRVILIKSIVLTST